MVGFSLSPPPSSSLQAFLCVLLLLLFHSLHPFRSDPLPPFMI